MDSSVKKVFVQEWRKEYVACVNANKLIDKIELMELLEKPTRRLNNQLKLWISKSNTSTEIIINLVRTGVIFENAADICRDELGSLSGYVCDCYAAVFNDYKPS